MAFKILALAQMSRVFQSIITPACTGGRGANPGDDLVQCDLAPGAGQVPEVFVVPAKAADMQDDSIQTIHFRLSGPLWRSSFHPDDQQFDKSEADVRLRVRFP